MATEERQELIPSAKLPNNKRVEQLKTVQAEALDLFKRKNADYGDAFAQDGTIGVLIRLGDKINRLKNISKTNITLVETESLRDTLIDLHNYSAMGIMLLDENQTNLITNNFSVIDSDDDDVFHYSNQLRSDDKCIIN
tara:strand:+ start:70 stop:483 length:414 start_codon:yes stop_codon:yes gene_type:complete